MNLLRFYAELKSKIQDIEKYISELKAKQVEFETVTENMSEGLLL